LDLSKADQKSLQRQNIVFIQSILLKNINNVYNLCQRYFDGKDVGEWGFGEKRVNQ